MFRIAICDDDEVFCNQLEKYMWSYIVNKEIEVDIYYSGEKIYDVLKNGNYYDILFLDIELNLMNGVELGKKIRNELNNNEIQIIYISGKQDYAMELFEVRPTNFLIKPLEKEVVLYNLNRVMKFIDATNICFECKIGSEWHRIPFGEIIFFESDNRKVIIHAKSKTIAVYGTLNKIEQNVPRYFVRIHQSYLVNRSYIKHWKYNGVTLINGDIIPISQSYRKKLSNGLFL